MLLKDIPIICISSHPKLLPSWMKISVRLLTILPISHNMPKKVMSRSISSIVDKKKNIRWIANPLIQLQALKSKIDRQSVITIHLAFATSILTTTGHWDRLGSMRVGSTIVITCLDGWTKPCHSIISDILENNFLYYLHYVNGQQLRKT